MHAFYYSAIFIYDKLSNLGNFSQTGNVFIKIGKIAYFLALRTGPFMGPRYIGRKIPDICMFLFSLLFSMTACWCVKRLFSYLLLLKNIRIFSGCEVQIENSVSRVTVSSVRQHKSSSVTEFLICTEQPLWISFSIFYLQK